jgi:hypothetical protein
MKHIWKVSEYFGQNKKVLELPELSKRSIIPKGQIF